MKVKPASDQTGRRARSSIDPGRAYERLLPASILWCASFGPPDVPPVWRKTICAPAPDQVESSAMRLHTGGLCMADQAEESR